MNLQELNPCLIIRVSYRPSTTIKHPRHTNYIWISFQTKVALIVYILARLFTRNNSTTEKQTLMNCTCFHNLQKIEHNLNINVSTVIKAQLFLNPRQIQVQTFMTNNLYLKAVSHVYLCWKCLVTLLICWIPTKQIRPYSKGEQD